MLKTFKGTFYIQTLGCKVNQYESEAVAQAWTKKGWVRVSKAAEANIILLNSCAVTARAQAEAGRLMRGFLRQKKKGALVIFTGCAANLLKETGLPESAELVLVAPEDKPRLAGLVDELAGFSGPALEQEISAPDSPGRSRALIKIQDGCPFKCAYCIVRKIRGASRSRPAPEIFAEILQNFHSGHAEVVLCGINLAAYAYAGLDFWDFIAWLGQKIEQSDLTASLKRFRIRLSSLDPLLCTAKGLKTLAAQTFLTPHLHISLQSASPNILAAMNRERAHPGNIARFIRGLSDFWPLFGLGADILTGFPGESEEDFLLTADFLRSLPFSYAHVFPFSARSGTQAATCANQLAQNIIMDRAALLRDLAKEKKEKFLQRISNLPEVTVSLENLSKSSRNIQNVNSTGYPKESGGPEISGAKASLEASGTTEYYISCLVKVSRFSKGSLVRARPTGIKPGGILLAEAVEEP